MRSLALDGAKKEDQEHFTIYYQAFALGEQTVSGIDGLKRATRTLDALSDVSKIGPNSKPDDTIPERVLSEGQHLLVLEESDYDWLKSIIETVKWKPTAAKRVMAALEFYKTAETMAVKKD